MKNQVEATLKIWSGIIKDYIILMKPQTSNNTSKEKLHEVKANHAETRNHECILYLEQAAKETIEPWGSIF